MGDWADGPCLFSEESFGLISMKDTVIHTPLEFSNLSLLSIMGKSGMVKKHASVPYKGWSLKPEPGRIRTYVGRVR